MQYKGPKHMPLKDKLILGPIDKYRIYSKINNKLTNYIDRFPWKMMISFLIVVFSTTQVEVLIKNTSDQNRA
jgi:hypothetical protein